MLASLRAVLPSWVLIFKAYYVKTEKCAISCKSPYIRHSHSKDRTKNVCIFILTDNRTKRAGIAEKWSPSFGDRIIIELALKRGGSSWPELRRVSDQRIYVYIGTNTRYLLEREKKKTVLKYRCWFEFSWPYYIFVHTWCLERNAQEHNLGDERQGKMLVWLNFSKLRASGYVKLKMDPIFDPTDPCIILMPQSPSIDVYEHNKVPRSTDFEALKLWRVGREACSVK